MNILILLGSISFAFAINGGEVANIGEFTHQVEIYKNGYFFCGGSIISSFLILTAAHCVVNNLTSSDSDDDFEVVGGNHKRIDYFGASSISKSTQRLKVRDFFVHPSFDETLKGENDIAILGVIEPFRYAKNVDKIALPFPKEDFDNSMATAIGHGASKTVETTNYLLKLEVNYGNSSNCDAYFEENGGEFHVASEHCIEAYDGIGICPGDSGGALVCRRKEKNGSVPVLCGISNGIFFGNKSDDCGNQDVSIFTKVQYYLDWIKNITVTYEALSRCDAEHFFCYSNQTCIPRANLCDKVAHCTEGEDELNCENFEKCGDAQFQCNNGHCIEASERCDGTFDCADSLESQLSSDEDKCPKSEDAECEETDHDCGANDRCLPAVYKCDGIPDCLNLSDEEGCEDNVEEDVTPANSGTSEWIWKIVAISEAAVIITILFLLFLVIAFVRSSCSIKVSQKQSNV